MLNYSVEQTELKDVEDPLANLTKRKIQAKLTKLEMKRILLQSTSIKSRIPLENTSKIYTPKS